MLGFSTARVLKPEKWYELDSPVNIINVKIVRIQCSITADAYANHKSVHMIHEFAPNMPPGYNLGNAGTNHLSSGHHKERY